MPLTMPFGKHKGRRLEQLPLDYLEWLQTLDLREPLRSQVRAEFDRRGFSQKAENRVIDPGIVDELVGAGVRALALRYHPDRDGGSHALMVSVNAAASWIRQQARALA